PAPTSRSRGRQRPTSQPLVFLFSPVCPGLAGTLTGNCCRPPRRDRGACPPGPKRKGAPPGRGEVETMIAGKLLERACRRGRAGGHRRSDGGGVSPVDG